jgi:hypothetical protein
MGLGVEMLRDDFNYLLATWFIDAIRPQQIASGMHYAHIFTAVRVNLKKRFPHSPQLVLDEASDSVARLLQDELSGASTTRKSYTTTEKYKLLSKCDRRCTACGFLFLDEIIDQFLGGPVITSSMFTFYDFLKPSRRATHDFRIEVDHIQAYVRGGGNDLDNLQLLCGFCNSAKFKHQTIFDPSMNKIELTHHNLGKIKLTNWFLVVRILLGNHCYYCGAEASSKELTIMPVVLSDEINPINIQVTCYDCDPLKTDRYVAAA